MEPPGMHLMRMKHLKCDYAIMSIIKMNMNLYESKFLTPWPKRRATPELKQFCWVTVDFEVWSLHWQLDSISTLRLEWQ